MISVLAHTLASAPRNCQPVPVTTPLGRWRFDTRFHPQARQPYRLHSYSTQLTPHLPERLCGSVTRCLGEARRQGPIQIPIAPQPISTALPHPAVSSLAAYQTPAR